jgi:HlyD family secretion protein
MAEAWEQSRPVARPTGQRRYRFVQGRSRWVVREGNASSRGSGSGNGIWSHLGKYRTVIIVSLVVLVLAGALLGLRTVRAAANRARAQASAYSTAKVTTGTLDVTITGTGTLRPAARQECLITAGGTVVSVSAQPGQVVIAGETLLVISNENLSDQVGQARLQLRLAEIDLDSMTRPGSGAATAADVAAARVAVEKARLGLDRAQDDVEHLTVRAPFTGRVSGLVFRAGQEVPPGATLLYLATQAKLKAILLVPENEVKHLTIGADLTVTITPLSRDLGGHVSAISATAAAGDRGAVNYQVSVSLDDSDSRARGGMSVSAEVGGRGTEAHDPVKVSGTLAYDRFEALLTATGGTVSTLAVTEDEAVFADQVLMTLQSDQAIATLAGARAELAQAEERLAQLTDPGPSSYPAAQIEKARLRVAEAGIALAGLERQLDDLTVKAAFDGTVTDVAVSAGEEVRPNTRVAVVADLSEVQAVILVDELAVANLAPGQSATVRLDALPGETFAGTLQDLSLEGILKDGVTNYEIHITFAGDPRLRAGMSVSASIQVARRENALLVPVEAVYGAGRQASVQVMVNGKPESRSIVAGLSNSTYTEILSGLAEGETVVTGSLETDNNLFGPPGQHPGSESGGGL